MHLRGLATWVVSAAVAAVLLGIVLWRAVPGPAPSWALVAAVWAGGTVVLHLVLHNRWMRALDERCHAALTGRRSQGAPGARGPAHAARRSGGPLARGPRSTLVPLVLDERVEEPVAPAPPLPPLRPARVASRYHHDGRSASSRPRAGRAAHR